MLGVSYTIYTAVASCRAGWVLARSLFRGPCKLHMRILNYVESKIATPVIPPCRNYPRQRCIRICAIYSSNFGSDSQSGPFLHLVPRGKRRDALPTALANTSCPATTRQATMNLNVDSAISIDLRTKPAKKSKKQPPSQYTYLLQCGTMPADNSVQLA